MTPKTEIQPEPDAVPATLDEILAAAIDRKRQIGLEMVRATAHLTEEELEISSFIAETEELIALEAKLKEKNNWMIFFENAANEARAAVDDIRNAMATIKWNVQVGDHVAATDTAASKPAKGSPAKTEYTSMVQVTKIVPNPHCLAKPQLVGRFVFADGSLASGFVYLLENWKLIDAATEETT